MSINAPAQPPANVAPPAPPASFSKLDTQYYNLAQEIAKDIGIDPGSIPQVPVETLATNMADFFDQKYALEAGKTSFAEIQRSWDAYILAPTDPDPLRLAMGGQLFAASIDDEITIDLKKIDPGVAQNFMNCAKQLGAKTEFDKSEKLVMRREDVMQAAVVYRLSHPSCTKKDVELYNSIAKGIKEKDSSIDKKNKTFGTITTALSVASMSLTAVAFFSPTIMSNPAIMIGVLAIQVLTMIPRIISLCRSLKQMGYNKEAKKIHRGLMKINEAAQMVINDTEKKTRRGFEYGIKHVQKAGTKPGFSEHEIGIKMPAKLNKQQQKAMNNAYNQNYPARPMQQGNPNYSLNEYNKARCQCSGRG